MRPLCTLPAAVLLALSFALLPALVTRAQAAWITDGVPVCTATGNQLAPQLIADGTGGAILTWEDRRSGGYDIYALRLTASGNIAPGWPVDGRVVSNATGDQRAPVLAPDGAGGAIIAWQDGSTGADDIYALRLTASGAIAAGWTANGTPIATGPRSQRTPGIVSDGAGGAIVAWGSSAAGANSDIYANHVSGAGVLDPAWPAGGALLSGAANAQTAPKVVTDGAHGAVVAWTDLRSGQYQVFATRVTAAGTIAPGWPADGALLIPAWDQGNPYAIAADGAGGLYMACDGIYLWHLDGAGAVPPGWGPGYLLLATGYAPSLAPDGKGGVLAAWYHAFSVPSVEATRIRPDGSRYPGWANAVGLCYISTNQYGPEIVADGVGGAQVAWMDRRSDPYQTDIYMNRLLATGRLPNWWMSQGQPVCIEISEQHGVRLAADGQGGAIAVWLDWRNGDFLNDQNSDLYAQSLQGNGPVPTLVSLVSADATVDHVTVIWQLAAGIPSPMVQRSGGGGGWTGVASVPPDGTGRVAYEDRDVVPGARYGYRLAFVTSGGEQTLGETWVTVPETVSFSLHGLVPNPASSEMVVSFALPAPGQATLELLDVSGRRLASREVGGLGPGRHLANLGSATGLRSGVYLLRLTQGGRSLTARASVVK